MAMSALRSSWASSRARRSSMAMPTLARTVTWPPTRGKGAARVAMTRSASRRAVARSVSSARMANSSPPSRPTVSCPRRQLRSRAATSRSSRSPAPWPRLSLTTLKSSRSTNSTARQPPSRRALDSACRTRSLNRARLARSVRLSWNAWCSSWVARASRSLSEARSTPSVPRSSRTVASFSRTRSAMRVSTSRNSRAQPATNTGMSRRWSRTAWTARMAGAVSEATARQASRVWVSPFRGAGTASVRVATDGSSTAAPHRA